MAHGTDCQEVIFMALAVCDTCLEEFAAGFSCGAHDRIFSTRLYDVLNDVFANHAVIVLIDNLRCIGQGSLADYKSHVLTG